MLLCVCGAVGGIGGVAGTNAGGAVAAQETATPTPTNNTTVQQENPDEVDEDGDTAAVRAYLTQKLAQRLGDSAIRISQGQYEEGQSIVGDQYDGLLEQYVDVEGDVDESSSSETLREAGDEQREFANETQQYNQTYQEYREAREAGNTTRARELARELNRLSEEINSTGQNLTRAYDTLENTTGADLTNASQAVNETRQSVMQQQQEVVRESFVETTLSVSVNRSTASFTQPMGVTGTITLENGSMLANKTVRIRVDGTERTVTTDAEGQFTVPYRPVRAPTGPQELTVAFLPADSSVYLGDQATVEFDVSQTTADLSVGIDASSARYGDQVVVTGQAVVDDIPVDGATVRVTIGDRPVGTATTGADGAYRLVTTLPATVTPGEANVTATIVPPDRAVRSDPARTTLEVGETATRLQLNVTQVSERQVRVSGRLETVDGRPVDGRPVDIRVNGTTVATIDTRADGSFARTVSLPGSVDGVALVEAQYDEPASNLRSSTTREQYVLETNGAADGEGGGLQSSVPTELLLGGGLVLASLLSIAWLLRRGGDEPTAEPSSSETTVISESESARERVTALSAAASRFENGEPDAAVRTLYAAMRQRLGSEDERTATHWEFYTTISERVDEETASLLERLTQAYERDVYSPAAVEEETVETLLGDAERLFGEEADSEAD